MNHFACDEQHQTDFLQLHKHQAGAMALYSSFEGCITHGLQVEDCQGVFCLLAYNNYDSWAVTQALIPHMA